MNNFEQNDKKKIIIIAVLALVELFLIWYISQGDAQRQKFIEVLQGQVETLESQLVSYTDSLEDSSNTIDNLNITIEEQDEIIEELIEQQEKLTETQQALISEIELLKTAQEYSVVPGRLTRAGGVAWFEGHKETYYNLPMDMVVMYAQQRIAGYADKEMWIREDGCKMLGDYIMVAADQTVHPYASIVMTSLGEGIVVDTGAFTMWNSEQIDIATNW